MRNALKNSHTNRGSNSILSELQSLYQMAFMRYLDCRENHKDPDRSKKCIEKEKKLRLIGSAKIHLNYFLAAMDELNEVDAGLVKSLFENSCPTKSKEINLDLEKIIIT